MIQMNNFNSKNKFYFIYDADNIVKKLIFTRNNRITFTLVHQDQIKLNFYFVVIVLLHDLIISNLFSMGRM